MKKFFRVDRYGGICRVVWGICQYNQRTTTSLHLMDIWHTSCYQWLKEHYNKIIIFKFPPHATDVLQPLDVSYFGLLKCHWEQLLQQWVNTFGAKTALSKEDFVNQLCKTWKDGVKSENIASSFASTGIINVLMLLW